MVLKLRASKVAHSEEKTIKAKGLVDTVTSQHSALAYRESDNYSVNSLGSPKLTWLPTNTCETHSVLLKS